MPNLYNLTGDLGDLLGSTSVISTAKAWLETNLNGAEGLIDTGDGGQVRLGGTTVPLDADGSFEVVGLVGSDSTDLNVEAGTLQYQLVVSYRDQRPGSGSGQSTTPRTYRSGWFYLNQNEDIRTVAKAASPAVVATGAEIIAAASAEADRAELAAESATAPTDTQVATLAQDPESETSAALSATYATVVGIGPASGTDDTAHINALLAANPGTIVRGTPGESYKISATLVVKSGTTLDMTGCTVTLLPGSDRRMVQNAALSGTGARDTDIHIKGGHWDRGANGGIDSNHQHSFVIHRADRVSFTDMRFTATGPCKYAYYFVDVTDAKAERLHITNISDGVHVTGPASRVTVRDISGSGDDDIVSFTGRDYTSYELTAGGGSISDIVVERIVCRGGLDPNTVKLLPGQGMTLSNAVVRDISGSPATSAVVLYNDTVQAATTGGTLSGVVIDGVSGTPGQRYVNVAHPDVRNLVIRNVTITANPTRAISFSGGAGAVVTDAIIDGVTANETFNSSLIHVGNPTTVNRLAISNVSVKSTGATTYFLNSDGHIGNLQVSNVHQIAGYGGVVIAGGTCPLVTINGYHSTASNNLIRLSAAAPVEAHLNGITAYPTGQLAIVLAGSLTLRVGSIVDGAGALMARTATQTLRAVGAGAKVNVSLLTPTTGDIVHNTNAAHGAGVGPVIWTGTQWKNLATGVAA